MPIYEYLCEKCGEFEVTQKITDKPLKQCPDCKGKVKKLISNTSFQLKGTGWYITDYGRKDKAPAEKKGDKAPAAEAKSDGKAASETSEKTAGEKPAKSPTGESAHPS
ncbi:MAG: zinc ribbon domain-containing protein [Deltaproteobacteria bacterium]|nr:zinc ribbon domain-containing protein [Deltaproteobacteria bacterium]